MNLSEAIKAGAKVRPQTFGKFFAELTNGSVGVGSCALGAAAEVGCGANARFHSVFGLVDQGRRLWDGLRIAFPLLIDTIAASAVPCQNSCRELPPGDVGLIDAISHLNDTHLWRRELIAQWVKTLEDGK